MNSQIQNSTTKFSASAGFSAWRSKERKKQQGGSVFATSTDAQQGDYRARMSREELVIFDGMTQDQQFAYLYNGDYAMSTAEGLFDARTLNNGRGDAFRHALFSALNSRDLGLDLAKRLGDAHELHPWETPLGRDMDLFNNDVGRQIFTILNDRGLAAGHYSTQGFVISVMLALEGGFLREIGGSPPGLIPTSNE